MNQNFDFALNFMLEQEGGVSNHSKDPGGLTNLGVTKKVWEEWVGHPVSDKDIILLTKADIAPLYQRKYWNATKCSELPEGIDLCMFDTAVNSGPGRSIKLLQGCLGVATDGAIGNNTLAAVKQFKGDALITLIESYCDMRKSFLISLPTWDTFGKGWSARVERLRSAAAALAGQSRP